MQEEEVLEWESGVVGAPCQLLSVYRVHLYGVGGVGSEVGSAKPLYNAI